MIFVVSSKKISSIHSIIDPFASQHIQKIKFNLDSIPEKFTITLKSEEKHEI